MAAGNWIIYNDFIASSYKKLMNLSADAIKVALVTSASNAINKAMVSAQYANITNELATANGYTAGGASAGSPTVAGGGATATITFDTADVSWTASGGAIGPFRAAVMYDNTAASKDLIAYCLLDNTPADVTINNGDTGAIAIANIFSAA